MLNFKILSQLSFPLSLADARNGMRIMEVWQILLI